MRLGVKIRHAPLMRFYLAAFAFLWTLIFFGFTGTLAADKTPLVIIPTALLIVTISMGVKMWRVGVFADGEELLVRNYFSTRRVARRAIRDFEVSTSGRNSWLGTTIYAQLKDGGIQTLDVFTRPYLSVASRARLENSVEELRRWLGR